MIMFGVPLVIINSILEYFSIYMQKFKNYKINWYLLDIPKWQYAIISIIVFF